MNATTLHRAGNFALASALVSYTITLAFGIQSAMGSMGAVIIGLCSHLAAASAERSQRPYANHHGRTASQRERDRADATWVADHRVSVDGTYTATVVRRSKRGGEVDWSDVGTAKLSDEDFAMKRADLHARATTIAADLNSERVP